jgi:hypothetical protein
LTQAVAASAGLVDTGESIDGRGEIPAVADGAGDLVRGAVGDAAGVAMHATTSATIAASDGHLNARVPTIFMALLAPGTRMAAASPPQTLRSTEA